MNSACRSILICFSSVSFFALTGCNEGGNDVDGLGGSILEHHDTFVTASIMDDYGFYTIGEQNRHQISLLKNIKLSENREVQIDEVKTLNNDHNCDIQQYDVQGFTIESNESIVCDYQYKIKLKEFSPDVHLIGDTLGYKRVVMSSTPSQDVELVPFGISVFQNSKTVVDIEQELIKAGEHASLEGFSLTDNVVITPLAGTSNVVVDPDAKTITYTPSSSFVGNERISYSLKKLNGEMLAGTFTVTVSKGSVQSISIDKKIEILDDIVVNEPKKISVEKYVTNVDDNYQLIYVSAFGANVKLTSLVDTDNKSFVFEAPMLGAYFVNVIVSDHRGGYDVGLIKVNVSDPATEGDWDSIWDRLKLFNAPLSTTDAIISNVAYTDSNFDDNANNMKGLWIASFNHNMAQDYCGTLGRLPSTTELKELYTNKSPVSKDWPTELAYWTNDSNTVVRLDTGEEQASKVYTGYYVTCVGVVGFDIDTVASDVTNVVADQSDKAKIVVKLTFNDRPLANEFVSISIPSSAESSIDASTVMTNSDGIVVFELSSLKAESFTATVTFKSQTRTINISFIGDAKTAELYQNTTIDYANIYTESNEVTASLIDANDNNVPFESISFVTSSPDVDIRVKNTETDASGRQRADITWASTIIPINDTSIEVSSSYLRAVDDVLFHKSSIVTFLVAQFTDLVVVKDYESIRDGINVVRAIMKDVDNNGKAGVTVNYLSSDRLCLINNNNAFDIPVSVVSNNEGHADVNITFSGIPENYPNGYQCDIEATYGNNQKTKKVNFASYICGGVINDKRNNSSGNCVKIASYPTLSSKGLITAGTSSTFWNTLVSRTNLSSYLSQGKQVAQTYNGYVRIGASYGHWNDTAFKGSTHGLCKAYNDIRLAGRTNWRSFRSQEPNNTYFRVSEITKKLGDMSKYGWPTVFPYSNERWYDKSGAKRLDAYNLINARQELSNVSNGRAFIVCYSPN
ncbi:Ig-like domain-containing protein [Vibrio hepatarius]|uniref:Ig-like domain-containing protein n=1 Tax=Vibrio hepatarius TaxID=171383 RepID=UPI003736EF48